MAGLAKISSRRNKGCSHRVFAKNATPFLALFLFSFALFLLKRGSTSYYPPCFPCAKTWLITGLVTPPPYYTSLCPLNEMRWGLQGVFSPLKCFTARVGIMFFLVPRPSVLGLGKSKVDFLTTRFGGQYNVPSKCSALEPATTTFGLCRDRAIFSHAGGDLVHFRFWAVRRPEWLARFCRRLNIATAM